MKTIPKNNIGPQWDNTLFSNFDFIRKHRRYPITRPRGWKAIFSTLFFLLSALMITWTLYTMKSRTDISARTWCILLGVVPIMIWVGLYNAYHSLKFLVIPTPFSAVENAKLVDEFLRSQQLNVFRHPQHSEVQQIISCPLGNEKGQREIMIFIADTNRILINSHFTNQRTTITAQSLNYRKMANRLKEWLKIHYPDANNTPMVPSLN